MSGTEDGWAAPSGPARVPPQPPPPPPPPPVVPPPSSLAGAAGDDGWNAQPYYAPGWQAPVPTEPPARRRSGRRALLVVGSAVLVLLLAAGTVGVRTWLATRPLGDVERPTDAHPGRLQPGSCLAELPSDGAVDGVRVVPCDVPHVAEVVGRLELPDMAWPGRESVINRLTPWCEMDTAEREAGFEPVVWLPTERGWGRGDRVGMCVAWLPDGTATGSFTDGDQVATG